MGVYVFVMLSVCSIVFCLVMVLRFVELIGWWECCCPAMRGAGGANLTDVCGT